AGSGRAGPPSGGKGGARSGRDAQALAARDDQLIAAGRAEANARPAAPADDGQFLSRGDLDIAARIPSAAGPRASLPEPRPDRRQRLVDRLLEGPAYIKHSANVWRALLVPEADFTARFTQPVMEAWLRKQFAANAGYDRMVRELLTTPVDGNRGLIPIGG